MEIIDNFYFKFRNKFACHCPVFYFFCEKRKSFLKFFCTGVFISILDIFFLFVFHDLLFLNIIYSTSLAFLLSFLLSFFLQKKWTFREFNQQKTRKQLSLYLLNAFLGLNLNGSLMHLLVRRFAWWYIFSQLFVNVIIGLYNFIVYKYLIFKKNEVNGL